MEDAEPFGHPVGDERAEDDVHGNGLTGDELAGDELTGDELTGDEDADGGLAGTGDRYDDDGEPALAVQRIAKKTVGGMMLAGAMGALGEIFHGRRKEEPAIMMEAAGEPDDDPYRLRLDPDDPAASTITIRPWLRKEEPGR